MRPITPSSAEVKNEWSYTAAPPVCRMTLQCTETRVYLFRLLTKLKCVVCFWFLHVQYVQAVFTRATFAASVHTCLCLGSVYTSNIPS